MHYESFTLSSFEEARPVSSFNNPQHAHYIRNQRMRELRVVWQSTESQRFEQSPTSSVFVLSFIRSVHHFAHRISLIFVEFHLVIYFRWMFVNIKLWRCAFSGSNEYKRPSKNNLAKVFAHKTAIKCLIYKSA